MHRSLSFRSWIRRTRELLTGKKFKCKKCPEKPPQRVRPEVTSCEERSSITPSMLSMLVAGGVGVGAAVVLNEALTSARREDGLQVEDYSIAGDVGTVLQQETTQEAESLGYLPPNTVAWLPLPESGSDGVAAEPVDTDPVEDALEEEEKEPEQEGDGLNNGLNGGGGSGGGGGGGSGSAPRSGAGNGGGSGGGDPNGAKLDNGLAEAQQAANQNPQGNANANGSGSNQANLLNAASSGQSTGGTSSTGGQVDVQNADGGGSTQGGLTASQVMAVLLPEMFATLAA